MKAGYRLFLMLLLGAISLVAEAQRLPGVQKISLRAPATVQIDGNAVEWGNKFQAYNGSTDVFYTIANDDENLYFVIRATNTEIINKAIRGGITLTINHSASKNDKEPAIITFPVASSKDGAAIGQSIMQKISDTRDSLIIKKQTDSLMAVSNKLIDQKLKLIKVLGIKAITDTFISVYNLEDIQVMAKFDHKRACTFEFAIPLSYLHLSINTPTPFAYNVQLNGAVSSGNVVISIGANGGMVMNVTRDFGSLQRSSSYPTDFWGEYTLAKRSVNPALMK